MDWITLVVAGLLETAWAVGLKQTAGFTRFWPTLLTLSAMGGSMLLLGLAVRTIPIGTAYAVWVGTGVLGAVVLGIALFGEPATAGRLFFTTMLLVAIAGLKFTAAA